MDPENDYHQKKKELIETLKGLDDENDQDLIIFNYHGKKEEIFIER